MGNESSNAKPKYTYRMYEPRRHLYQILQYQAIKCRTTTEWPTTAEFKSDTTAFLTYKGVVLEDENDGVHIVQLFTVDDNTMAIELMDHLVLRPDSSYTESKDLVVDIVRGSPAFKKARFFKCRAETAEKYPLLEKILTTNLNFINESSIAQSPMYVLRQTLGEEKNGESD